MTKMWLQEATTAGQKMGMEAHMMAKSISRHEKMSVCGYQKVKSKLLIALLLCLKVLQRRRMAIKTTLTLVLAVIQTDVCVCVCSRGAYIDPSENKPVMASNCLRFRSGRKNSVRGMKNIAMSKIMFVDANARTKLFDSTAVRNPKP